MSFYSKKYDIIVVGAGMPVVKLPCRLPEWDAASR